jgi:hypothetical protein
MAGAPAPVLVYVPWAEAASATYVNSPMPVPSQLPGSPGRASYTDGFPPQTFESILSGGTGPDGRDMNGVLKDITTNLVAWTGGQRPQFNATFATEYGGYAVGAIVAMANGTGEWINITSGNSNNPDTAAAATSGWVPLNKSGQIVVTATGATTTLTAVQAACNILSIGGAVNTDVVFPPWPGMWLVYNANSGTTTVTAGGAGSFTLSAGYFGIVIVSTGGNIYGTLAQPAFNT